ncbi:glutathione S-transferase [Cladophialophora carrionii]|uniref:Glutathione S-transferase n=1 Tax=Cladophialophora carrionii TaxID=86049 RepID=A0A1C1CTG4_9EURO|nr:glutathione S-transferase [Cladophialophora carrionii]
MATSTRSSKRQKTDGSAADSGPTSGTSSGDSYRLIYWPGIPGRGEHIRLAFEATGTAYTDVANTTDEGVNAVLSQISDKNLGDETNPPPLAPPILQHGTVLLSQTPNILSYLGLRLGLVPDPNEDPAGLYHVNALTLTALDGLSNEPHDTHHPIASGAYYEEQKEEAKKKAADYRAVRLPKFLGYFERVLKGPASQGGQYLYGGKLTYADLVLFQTLDGVSFAFPRRVRRLRETGEYDAVWGLYERVKGLEKASAYLASERRKGYSMGIYRHYEELDDEE